jgi:hypothetical protein
MKKRPKQRDTSFGPQVRFFFLLFLYILTNVLGVLKVRKGLKWAATAKKGPNDVSHVVWALGEFFFFSSFSYHTNYLFRSYLCCMATSRLRMGGMGDDRKKMAQTT